MDMSSPTAITTQTWDSFLDNPSNQTGEDFFFHWTNRQISILAMMSWIRLAIILTNILTNTFTLYLEIKNKFYLKPRFIFAITLTTSDWSSSCALALEWYGFSKQDVPRYVAAIVTSSAFLSLLSTTAVAFDRYLALHVIPLEYKLFITAKKYAVAAFFMIFSSAAFGSSLGFAFPYGHPVFSVCGVLVGVVFTSATIFLYVALGHSLSKAHTKLQVASHAKLRRLRQTRKILFTFSTIIVTNVLLLLPSYLFVLYVAVQPANKQYNVFLNVMLANLFHNILVANYTVNPLIFIKSVLRPYLPRPCREHGTKSGDSPLTYTTKGEGNEVLTSKAGISVISVSVRLKSVPSSVRKASRDIQLPNVW